MATILDQLTYFLKMVNHKKDIARAQLEQVDCCHCIALLLFIKHYSFTGERILALTCNQKLQKWHKRSKGSIHMIPLNQIKIKSAKMRKDKTLVPADPDKSKMKKDVPSIVKKIQLNIRKCPKPDVSKHFYSVLSKSKVGRSSSYGEHICFKVLLNSLGDHQYISKQSFQENVLGIPKNKEDKIQQKIDEKSDSVASSSRNAVPENNEN